MLHSSSEGKAWGTKRWSALPPFLGRSYNESSGKWQTRKCFQTWCLKVNMGLYLIDLWDETAASVHEGRTRTRLLVDSYNILLVKSRDRKYCTFIITHLTNYVWSGLGNAAYCILVEAGITESEEVLSWKGFLKTSFSTWMIPWFYDIVPISWLHTGSAVIVKPR